MCPYREGDYVGPLTPEMRAFNTVMSRVRISVEWLFGDITNYFKFIDYKKDLENWYECSRQTIHSLCTHKEYFNMSLSEQHI